MYYLALLLIDEFSAFSQVYEFRLYETETYVLLPAQPAAHARRGG